MRAVGNFFKSEEGIKLGKQNTPLGKKVRGYRKRYTKDELRPSGALMLLLDADRVKKIDFIDI